MPKELFVDEEELATYLFKGLIELGYLPTEDELEDIAALVFDYLDELGMEMEEK
jgi:hypothetical protein